MRTNHPLSRLTTRIAYASTQLPRLAWYSGHFYLMRRLAEYARQPKAESARPKQRSDPHIDERLKADMLTLLKQDIANVEAGIYRFPRPMMGRCLPCWTGRCDF